MELIDIKEATYHEAWDWLTELHEQGRVSIQGRWREGMVYYIRTIKFYYAEDALIFKLKYKTL